MSLQTSKPSQMSSRAKKILIKAKQQKEKKPNKQPVIKKPTKLKLPKTPGNESAKILKERDSDIMVIEDEQSNTPHSGNIVIKQLA